jgi:hypothetical protein
LCRALHPIIEEFYPRVLPYVDDLLVLSSNPTEYLELLDRLLSKLEEYNITINYKKPKFFRQEISFVGFIINRERIRPIPEKITLYTNSQNLTANDN